MTCRKLSNMEHINPTSPLRMTKLCLFCLFSLWKKQQNTEWSCCLQRGPLIFLPNPVTKVSHSASIKHLSLHYPWDLVLPSHTDPKPSNCPQAVFLTQMYWPLSILQSTLKILHNQGSQSALSGDPYVSTPVHHPSMVPNLSSW